MLCTWEVVVVVVVGGGVVVVVVVVVGGGVVVIGTIVWFTSLQSEYIEPWKQ